MLRGNLILNVTLYTYRTKVECGGQCLTNPSCDAFNFVNNVCKILKSELLFLDGTTQTEAYVLSTTVMGNAIK